MPEPVDLSTPASRREALRMVNVGDPRPHHAMLQEIFDLERAWREGLDVGECDEYEQIYVTAGALRPGAVVLCPVVKCPGTFPGPAGPFSWSRLEAHAGR